MTQDLYIIITAENICKGLTPALKILGLVFLAIRIIVPIMLIVLSMFQLVKSIINENPDNEAKNIINKVIAAIAIFMVFTLVKTVVKLVSPNYETSCTSCIFDISKCDEIISNSNSAQPSDKLSDREIENAPMPVPPETVIIDDPPNEPEIIDDNPEPEKPNEDIIPIENTKGKEKVVTIEVNIQQDDSNYKKYDSKCNRANCHSGVCTINVLQYSSLNGKTYYMYKQGEKNPWSCLEASGSNKGSISKRGCGITAAASIMSGYGIKDKSGYPLDPGDLSYGSGFSETNVFKNQNSRFKIESICNCKITEKLEKCNECQKKKNNIINALKSNKELFIKVTKKSVFTNSQHYMAVVDYDEKNDKVYLLNSASNQSGDKQGWLPYKKVFDYVASVKSVYK